MRGKKAVNVLLVLYCINMVLVELPRLFLSAGMLVDEGLREGLVMMGFFILSTIGLVGVAYGKWVFLAVGLIGHTTVATTGLIAARYGDFTSGFLASTACSLSIVLCALMPGVLSYIASGQSVVDSE